MNKKPILCLDFDGVCHSYISGWQGADIISDDPVPGLFDFLARASVHFELCVFSSRSGQPGGIEAMREWFGRHGGEEYAEVLSQIELPTEKPPAFLTIDDRAYTFRGIWPTPSLLIDFRPWNKI